MGYIYDDQLNITQTGYIIYCLIYICMYVYCLVIPVHSLPSFLTNIQKSCVVSCGDDKQCLAISNKTRGNNLFLGGASYQKEEKEIKKCRYTAWNCIHFFAYGLITYVFPSLWALNLMVSSAFEFYEYEYADCHDLRDIFANGLGIGLGYLCSPYKK